jgi:hypothetical protein
MKKVIGFFLVGVAVIAQAAMLHAATSTMTYSLGATIPTATGVSISASQITGSTWATVSGSALNFGTLSLKTYDGNQVYEATSYFAIDVAGSGGAGTPNTTVVYTDLNKPPTAGTNQTLGNRSNVSFLAVKYNNTKPGNSEEFDLTAHPKKLLVGLNETISAAQVTATTGTWLRIYIGLNNGLTQGMVPFTPADPSGTYTGSLQVTATL